MTARRRPRLAWAALGVAAALVPGVAMWGFTVDDALISVRYAENLARGVGWRFDPASDPTDGVTPLPWPILLAIAAELPTRASDALAVLGRAKVLGLVAWTVAAAGLGVRVRAVASSPLAAGLALALLALAFPVAAWAGSGMETGVAIALATGAAIAAERPRVASALAGVAATFRPELAPWALALALGTTFASVRGPDDATKADPAAAFLRHLRRVVVPVALAIGPFAVVVALRLAVFGRPTPLAVLAKPSDLDHGLRYAGAAALVLLLPVAAFAPTAMRGVSGASRAVAVAFLVHVVAVALAGGDWMPYARLVVPVAPSLAVVVAELGSRGESTRVARLTFGARAVAAFVLGVALASRAAPAGRGVLRDRTALVHAARPVLADARVVAALDVGWVSAATDPATRLVDLAGLTDPAIAVLGGGHTSKRVDVTLLESREVDTVLVYDAPRVVEQRLLSSERFHALFRRTATLALGPDGASYGVYRRVVDVP